MGRVLCAVLACVLSACGSDATVSVVGTVVDAESGRPLEGAEVRASGGAETLADEHGNFEITVAGEEGIVRAVAPGRCPGEGTRDGSSIRIELPRRFTVSPDQAQVGFGTTVEVRVSTPCDEHVFLNWTQLSGTEITPQITDGGRRLTLRLPRYGEVFGVREGLEVVPVSRTQRNEFRFRVETEIGGHPVEREVRFFAAPASTGGTQVPVGADVIVHGESLALMARPEGSHAAVDRVDGRFATLRPDRAGHYDLRSGDDTLRLVAAPFSAVDPVGCAGPSCHREAAMERIGGAHLTSFERGVRGELGPGFSEPCWTCHGSGGGWGLDNGGLRSLGSLPEPLADWLELPEAHRAIGPVSCVACHGAGEVLAPEFRDQSQTRFSSAMCAGCHDVVDDPDANHQSFHQLEWNASPKAETPSGAAARQPGCASCHSAQGFIHWMDAGTHRAVPEPQALGCSTCHDAHGNAHPASLRVFETIPELLDRPVADLGSGAICAQCHHSQVPDDDDPSAAPHAPQLNMLVGRGSLLTRAEEAGAHASISGSCNACHMAEPPADWRGRAGGHTFSVRDRMSDAPILAGFTCASCHGTAVPPQAIGGIRDWDGDGRADNIGREFARAMDRAREQLRARIGWARVRDNCAMPRLAEDYVERDLVLLLADREGNLLGDCDEDGAFSARERPVGVEQLSRDLRKVVWDVAMLESDGSQGRHNPAFTFQILREVAQELR
ncbi:MAG: hypothetical protein AAGF12_09390 [Myxococcota bacterium]